MLCQFTRIFTKNAAYGSLRIRARVWHGAGPSPAFRLTGRMTNKILLAEDDTDMRRFLVKALQTAGLRRHFLRQRHCRPISACARSRSSCCSPISSCRRWTASSWRGGPRNSTPTSRSCSSPDLPRSPSTRIPRPRAGQGPVQAVPSSRSRQRGRQDARGMTTNILVRADGSKCCGREAIGLFFWPSADERCSRASGGRCSA